MNTRRSFLSRVAAALGLGTVAPSLLAPHQKTAREILIERGWSLNGVPPTSYAYQWFVDGNRVEAPGGQYVVRAEDQGKEITARMEFANADAHV